VRSETYSWTSAHLGREMEVVRHGERGAAWIYAPSSGGDATEFANYGLDRVAAPWIETGRVQVFSVDAAGPRSWWDDAKPPAERVAEYVRLERYLKGEVVPWVLAVAGTNQIGILGASYGGFVAANLWLKLPAIVRQGCGLGGVYGLWHRLDGYHDGDVYFHTPLEFLPGLDDPALLAPVRATRGFDLFAADGDSWKPMSERFAAALRDKSLPHTLDVWPRPADHHERWWREQFRVFLARRFGSASV